MKKLQNNTVITANNMADNQSFNIHTLQWVVQNNDRENNIAQSLHHFQIIWIIKGSGDFYIDLQKYFFRSNRLFFVKPYQVCRLELVDPAEGYIISFTESFLGIENQTSDPTYHNSLFQMFTNTNGIEISNEFVMEMKDFAAKMIKEHNNLHLFRNELLRRYLKIFFIYLSRHFEEVLQTTRQTRNIELVQKFMSLVDKHFKTEKMVAGYAGMLSVTPNYMNEVIKKVTGCSAGYHIRQRIILEAKRQATYSDTCMKQIGYYLGFNDMAHFSKFFKTATGMNFTDFKKEKIVFQC